MLLADTIRAKKAISNLSIRLTTRGFASPYPYYSTIQEMSARQRLELDTLVPKSKIWEVRNI
jgi:hypothetical protein